MKLVDKLFSLRQKVSDKYYGIEEGLLKRNLDYEKKVAAKKASIQRMRSQLSSARRKNSQGKKQRGTISSFLFNAADVSLINPSGKSRPQKPPRSLF